MLKFLPTLVMLSFSFPSPAAAQQNDWQVLTSGVDTNLRGISANYASTTRPGADSSVKSGSLVIWVCGSNGVILRSTDSGRTWKQLHIEGADKADFRGIRSFAIEMAYVISVGDTGKSHIYKTTDGGQSWRLQYSDDRKEFFLDGLVCGSDKDCFAISDPVDGKFLLLRTDDGDHWRELPRDQMPAALPKEGIFAASNSAFTICGAQDLLFGTGGPAARVFHSADLGQTWNVAQTPIVSGNASSGIFSVRCSAETVVAVGGDYANTSQPYRPAAYSRDRGNTWKLAEQGPRGFRSAVEFSNGSVWIAVGPTGEDASVDQGQHWNRSGALNLNAIAMVDGAGIMLAAGANGTVVSLQVK